MSSLPERKRENTPKGKEYAVDLLSKEVKRLQRKLENQKSLFTDLMEAKKVDIVKQELEKLEKILHDLGSTSARLHGLLPAKEASQQSDMFVAEELMVDILKKVVSKWMASQIEIGARSGGSRSSKHSTRSGVSLVSAGSKRVSARKAEIGQELSQSCNKLLGDHEHIQGQVKGY